MVTDEMPNDDEFMALMQQEFGEDEFIALTDEDVLHGFLAFAQALECLSAREVLDVLLERHSWFNAFWHETTLDAIPGDQEEALDAMTQFNKDCYRLLNEWIRERDMGRIRLWVFFSCHNSFGHLTLNPHGDSVDPNETD